MSKVVIIGAGGVGGVVAHNVLNCPMSSLKSFWPAGQKVNAIRLHRSWTDPLLRPGSTPIMWLS